MPWAANWPPSGTTFVIVGLVCAATGGESIKRCERRGARKCRHHCYPDGKPLTVHDFLTSLQSLFRSFAKRCLLLEPHSPISAKTARTGRLSGLGSVARRFLLGIIRGLRRRAMRQRRLGRIAKGARRSAARDFHHGRPKSQVEVFRRGFGFRRWRRAAGPRRFDGANEIGKCVRSVNQHRDATRRQTLPNAHRPWQFNRNVVAPTFTGECDRLALIAAAIAVGDELCETIAPALIEPSIYLRNGYARSRG